MKIKIEFRTDNAAFEGGDYPVAIAKILDEAQTQINFWRESPTGWEFAIRDFNGNSVGTVRAELEE